MLNLFLYLKLQGITTWTLLCKNSAQKDIFVHATEMKISN